MSNPSQTDINEVNRNREALSAAVRAAGKRYASLEAAAGAGLALALLQPDSTRYEYGGIIYTLEDAYLITTPKGGTSRDAINVTVEMPADATLAAIYHTHPEGSRTTQGLPPDRFSEADIAAAERLAVPNYMAYVGGRVLRVFIPGTSHVASRRLPDRRWIRSCAGEDLGALPA